jgi:hypothetical protein
MNPLTLTVHTLDQQGTQQWTLWHRPNPAHFGQRLGGAMVMRVLAYGIDPPPECDWFEVSAWPRVAVMA